MTKCFIKGYCSKHGLFHGQRFPSCRVSNLDSKRKEFEDKFTYAGNYSGDLYMRQDFTAESFWNWIIKNFIPRWRKLDLRRR